MTDLLSQDLAKILKAECERIWEEEGLAFTNNLSGWIPEHEVKNRGGYYITPKSNIFVLFKGRKLNTLRKIRRIIFK